MPPPSRTAATAALSLVERTSLPRILVHLKGAVKYYAYVNAYIVGEKFRLQGTEVTPLYYLSLVAMHGQGSILEGIWSSLIANTVHDVYLDGVGTVALAHRCPEVTSVGYTLHWNYRQTSLPNKDLHRVVESNMLTMYDPMRGLAPVQRVRKQRKGHKPTRKARGQERVEGSTASKKALGATEELHNRERHPLFLLLVPGNEQPERLAEETDEVYRARAEAFVSGAHFTFLNMRAPWAMATEWSEYLWQRGVARGENRQLKVWCAQVPQDEDMQGASLPPPLFSQAWLCRPDIELLNADLKQALLDGRISKLVAEEAVPALA